MKLIYEGTEVEAKTLEEAKAKLEAAFPEIKDAAVINVDPDEEIYVVQRLFGTKGD